MLKNFKLKKGEAYIDLIVSFICLMIVLFLAIQIFQMFTVRNNLSYIAKQLIQTATTYGQFGVGDDAASASGCSVFVKHRNVLKDQLGFDVLTCDFSGTKFYDGSDAGTSNGASADYKVQLGEIMRLKVSTTKRLGSGFLGVTLNISSNASGTSEKYWKEP